MDGPEGIISQIYDFTYMWNLKNKTINKIK